MSENQNTELATTVKAPVIFSDRGIQIGNVEDLFRIANMVVRSGLAPKGFDKPESVCVAIQMGAEVGLPPMASLQNIAVINGRPSIWGDAMLGICRSTGELRGFREWFEQGGNQLDHGRAPSTFGDDVTAVCQVTRAGFEPYCGTFSVADAKRAGLWNKQGPWTQYPARMLKFRARSFALRDTFGDALRGFRMAEELNDGSAIDIETVVVGNQTTPAPATLPTPVSNPAPESGTSPQTEDDGAAPLSPQDQLKAAMEAEGVGFVHMVDALVANGNMKEVVDTWDDVPLALTKRMLRNVPALVKLVKSNMKEASND